MPGIHGKGLLGPQGNFNLNNLYSMKNGNCPLKKHPESIAVKFRLILLWQVLLDAQSFQLNGFL
jgi:hypothetical protein